MLTCTLDKLLYHLCSQFVTHPPSCYLICSSILLASMQPDLLDYTLLAPCNIFRMTSEFTISNLLAYCTLLLLKVSLQYFFLVASLSRATYTAQSKRKQSSYAQPAVSSSTTVQQTRSSVYTHPLTINTDTTDTGTSETRLTNHQRFRNPTFKYIWDLDVDNISAISHSRHTLLAYLGHHSKIVHSDHCTDIKNTQITILLENNHTTPMMSAKYTIL